MKVVNFFVSIISFNKEMDDAVNKTSWVIRTVCK